MKSKQQGWDNYFIRMAMLIATKSKDPSTQVGCVIVGSDNEIRSTGFNGFPRGVHETRYLHSEFSADNPMAPVEEVDVSYRWERPAKYEWVEHAERNAIYNAARIGVGIKGCRAYLNWEPRPCVECCKGFIQSGITEVIGPDIPFPSGGTRKNWKFEVSTVMMDEAGVGCRSVEWKDEKESLDSTD